MIDISEQKYADNLLREVGTRLLYSKEYDSLQVTELRKICIETAIFIVDGNIKKNKDILATQFESMGYTEWYVDYFEKVKKILENQ